MQSRVRFRLFSLTPARVALFSAVLGGAVSTGLAVSAHARQAVPPSPQAAEVAQAIQSARVFRDAGLTNEALNAMAGVLKKYPANADAARFQIETLVARERVEDGLTVYDGYVAARKSPDPAALGTLARGDLRRTVRTHADQPALMAQALERLARDGDAEALRVLKQVSASSGASSLDELGPTIGLARLKAPEAEAKLALALAQSQGLVRAQVIQAIRDADARSLALKVADTLADPDPNVRNAAAVALGLLQDKTAAPALQAAFDSGAGAVKMFAAVALKQLGQNSADTFLAGLLNGQIAELRVIAADAYRFSTTKSPQWDKAVRELMSGPNDQHKLQAAEMLTCCDMPAARSLLTSALASPNPLMRAGAAKIFEARKELADPAIARRVMGDAVPGVRAYGSGLALVLAKGAR